MNSTSKNPNTQTLKRGLLAAAALMLSFSALAQVNVDDVKADTIAPPGGIKLHGFFNADVLPLPPGSWKVLSRTDSVMKVGYSDEKFVQISLQSNDAGSSIPFMNVKVNLDTPNVNYGAPGCLAFTANNKISNDFGSTSGQLVQRCAVAVQMPWFTTSFVPGMSKNSVDVVGDLYLFMIDRLDVFASTKGEGTWVNFITSKARGHHTVYQFVLKTTGGQGFGPGTPKYEAVKTWIQATGDAVGDYLNGKTVELPAFKEPSDVIAVIAPAIQSH